MNSKFSKIGFILAVAGSAVGLGNAWKFPTLVGENGGSAFVLLYLILTLGVAFVIFLAELSLGKLSEKDPVNAYKTLAPAHKKAWSFAGFTMIGGILIVSFYSMVIGWILKYVYLSASGNLPLDFQASKELFNHLLTQDYSSQIICFTLIFLFVFYVVSKGVKEGIEKLNVWIMPTLFILLLIMLFYSASKDGFSLAVQFLLKPDFSKIGIESILEALGLAFFSLSLGVGTIITYSASLPDKTNFISSSLSIVFINIFVGILMGPVVFTFIFEFGANPSQQGPGLIFISLTTLFAKFGVVGCIFATIFFISLIFAGVTSAISMIEPFTFYLINTFKMSRLKALVLIDIIVYILGVSCILSFMSSTSETFSLFGKSVFDILDFLSSKLIMPIGGILTAIFTGFIIDKQKLQKLFEPYVKKVYFELWYIFLRFVSPLAVVIIMIVSK